jgi:5-methylcytosine-specific restriction endonuclease McrA
MATAYRRSYRAYYLSRTACFAPALGLPVYGWEYLGRPVAVAGADAVWWAAAGLGVLVLAGLLIIPGLFVTVVAFGPDLPKRCVPRSWRAGYRSRHGRIGAKSSVITERTRRLVYAADRHRCVWCGSRVDLAVDHHVAWAWGGLTILANLFTLCGTCNGRKLDYWEDWHGTAHFSRHFNLANRDFAHAVFRRERWRKWSPFRMIRIAWALGR